MTEALPDIWVIFDSQGYYNAVEGEDEARKFCERYNARTDDPLKPYTMRRYILVDAMVMTDDEIDAIFAEHHDQQESPWVNWRRFARAILSARRVA